MTDQAERDGALTPAEVRAHKEWLGLVQPVGLVASVSALAKARLRLAKESSGAERAFAAFAPDSDFERFAREILGFGEQDLELPGDSLDVVLRDCDDVLRPSFVGVDGNSARVALVSVVPSEVHFDRVLSNAAWKASPEARLERLLREREIPVGLLWNGRALRLVYAPRGESTGHVTFELAAMVDPSGRLILRAMLMLLSRERMIGASPPERLTALLAESRRHQDEVSTRLSEQVLVAMHDLLRGFDVANGAAGGALLAGLLPEKAEHVYGGLLATLLRLVFLLYAEDRGVFPEDPLYVQHYSVAALFESLGADAARHPGAMDRRFGAWARVLSLFRLVHDGGQHGAFQVPPRRGRLFDPDAYPFLEGRPLGSTRHDDLACAVPRISDAVVYAVLEKLVLLDGDRISYRALDVEQIGSVYESMMGFGVEVLTEPSIAVRPHHVVVGLASLLSSSATERMATLVDDAGCRPNAKQRQQIGAATSVDALSAALGKLVSPLAPGVLAKGSLALQPGEARRRSGSHYTPRALTEPMVATTLGPVLEALGPSPSANAILNLTVCDPAMGSGAFLVAACRALGDAVLAAWQRDGMPELVDDEDPVVHARRRVAERCLYGVDKNPIAVDLAKLSLWLVTLAKDQSFAFLDHAIRQGDSLVGLSRQQIAAFHWRPGKGIKKLDGRVDEAIKHAETLRRKLRSLGGSASPVERASIFAEAEEATKRLRKLGDLIVDAFFSGKTEKAREARLAEYRAHVEANGLDHLPETPDADARTPFHWEVEFPEVFADEGDVT